MNSEEDEFKRIEAEAKRRAAQDDEYGLDAIAFVEEWKAAQRHWVGLTEEDWGWVADRKGTSLDSFDQGAAWAQARLQERNT